MKKVSINKISDSSLANISVNGHEILNTIVDYLGKVDKEYVKKLDEKFEDLLSDNLRSRQSLIDELSIAYRSENLVFVFGAGISKEFGLPDWNTLLQKLILKSFKIEGNHSYEKARVLAQLFTEIFYPSPLIAARYLKNHFARNKSKKFEEEVREALYEDISNDTKSKVFHEVLQFCAAARGLPSLNSIITYNYDDILEEYLSNQNIRIPFKPIYKVGTKSERSELPIYHIHGFLPRKGEIDSSINITLSEDSYHQQYNDVYSWNNIIQINKFRDNNCLFIGVSLTDPNLRRILDIANTQRGDEKPSHYIIKKKYDAKILLKNLQNVLEKNKNLYNEKVIADLTLNATIENLVKMMESYEEGDSLSFGINTIWVDKFEEIPDILKKIRKE